MSAFKDISGDTMRLSLVWYRGTAAKEQHGERLNSGRIALCCARCLTLFFGCVICPRHRKSDSAPRLTHTPSLVLFSPPYQLSARDPLDFLERVEEAASRSKSAKTSVKIPPKRESVSSEPEETALAR